MWKVHSQIEASGTSTSITVHVVKGMYGLLLSYRAAVNRVTKCDQLENEYTGLFQGIGNLIDYELY